MAPLVQPRTLKGFRDYPPALMVPRERLLETARNVFRSYGFAPIDTPALEYTEVLLAKVEEGAEVVGGVHLPGRVGLRPQRRLDLRSAGGAAGAVT